MNELRWFTVVNPKAGRTAPSVADIESLLASRGIRASVVATTSAEHLQDLVSQAASSGTRHFLSVGGDGTAHHVINGLARFIAKRDRRFALGIVAAGSGSDFVRTFGQSEDIGLAVGRLVNPDLYPIDIGSISGSFGTRLFLNAANVGVAAASARVASRLPNRLGALRYTAGFWLALARFREAPVTVTVGRHEFSGNAISVVIANGQFFAGGMNVAPKATLTDGLLDVQVFRGPRRLAFSVMPRVVKGTHLTHTAVRRYIGDTISITVPASWPVETDGEMLGSGPVKIRTIASAIDFVT